MISTKQLSYALAVERTLHFKKAAADCNISQSALSTALSELERQLGLQIFERDNKKVLMTHLGEIFLEKAAEVSLQFSELEKFEDKFFFDHEEIMSLSIKSGFNKCIFLNDVAERLEIYEKSPNAQWTKGPL